MTNEITFEFRDDVLVKCIPIPQYGKDICTVEEVINKETFVKCYEKWIKADKENTDETDN